MARVDGLPKSSGGQDSHEEDVGEEGEVGEHQEGVEFHLAWFLLNLSQSWPFAKTWLWFLVDYPQRRGKAQTNQTNSWFDVDGDICEAIPIPIRKEQMGQW